MKTIRITKASSQAKRLQGRRIKSFRIGLDVPALLRLIRLEDATKIPAEVWVKAAMVAMLEAFESKGSLMLPLCVVPFLAQDLAPAV
jgi:hypothetical protein